MVGVMDGEIDDVFEARFSTRGADGGFEVVGFCGGAVGLRTVDHGGDGGSGGDGAEGQ